MGRRHSCLPSRDSLRLLCAALSFCFTTTLAQTPADYFESAGAGYRTTAEEQQLFWKPHIEESHRQILKAAGLVSRKEVATLLGPGVCSEIPLEQLAQQFERIVLVDMDGASMVEAVEQLPLELRPKVELRVSDVTSFAALLMERLQEAVETSDSKEEAFQQFDQIFHAMKTGEYPLRLPTSDLVISSLVLSELPRYPMAYADRLVRTQLKTRIREWSGHEPARERLRQLLIEDHIQLLANLVRKDGIIYFSDTVSRGPAYAQFPESLRKSTEVELAADFPPIARLCHGDHGVDRETQAFEALLAAYERVGNETFEPLLPMDQVKQQWTKHGLKVLREPAAWWWLEYPCAIVHSPGGFRVRSWVLAKR